MKRRRPTRTSGVSRYVVDALKVRQLEGMPVEITVALPTTGGEASPEMIRTVAVEADSRGWRTVWTVERLLCPDPTVEGATRARDNYRVVFDPLESIAWAAAQTSSLRFGTSVLDALFHPPVVLARRLATADRLSEGRLVVGLGQGWMPEEFEAAGVRSLAGKTALRTTLGRSPVRGGLTRSPTKDGSTGYHAAASLPNRSRPEDRRF